MTRGPQSGSDLPLMRWGDELRRARIARTRLRRQIIGIGGLACVLGATIILPPVPRLVWNMSASAPLGLYRVIPNVPLHVGDMVVAKLPVAFAPLASERHYLPLGVPLVKQIVAMPGDDVCATDNAISIDGRFAATRRIVDRLKRPLPHWTGCHHLRDGDLFLLMGGVPASFDGRYFGVTHASDVIGKAQLIWAR